MIDFETDKEQYCTSWSEHPNPNPKILDLYKAENLSAIDTWAELSLYMPKISEECVLAYASTIISNIIFNVHHRKMLYKTETWSTVVWWSKRSAKSFAFSVAATHFLLNLDPSLEITKESRKLWNLVKEFYTKMINRDNQ